MRFLILFIGLVFALLATGCTTLETQSPAVITPTSLPTTQSNLGATSPTWTTVPSATPSTTIPTTRSVSPISEVEVLETEDTWDADVDADGIIVHLTFKDINGEIVRFSKGQNPRYELEVWTSKTVGDDYYVKDQLMYSGEGTLETSETVLRVPYDDWNIPSEHDKYGMTYVRVYTPDGMVFEGRDTVTVIPY